MAKRLTLDIVKGRLKDINPFIEILSDEYVNANTKLKCRCKIDGHIWYPTWANLSMKHGCPVCSGRIVGGIDDIKSRLLSITKIISIEEETYINNNTPMKCLCKICGHRWSPTWASLRQGCGCPRCANNLTLTIEIVRYELSKINPNIEILSSEYVNNHTPLKCRCKIDGHVWYKSWNKLKQGIGCAKCAGVLKLTLNEIIDVLKTESPTLCILSKEYRGSSKKMEVMCKICGHKWKIKWSKLQEGCGCPVCVKNAMKLTLEHVKSELLSINTEILILSESYINAHSKLKCKCLKCENEWWSSWNNLKQGAGCPSCAIKNIGWTRSKWKSRAESSRNFDSFKLYIIRCCNNDEYFFKIGRTFTTIKERFLRDRDMPYHYDIVTVIESDESDYIYDLENRLQKLNKKYKYKPKISFGGETECFSSLDDILHEIEKLDSRKEVKECL